MTTIDIPEEFEPLFGNDWREAAVWGGRYSMKSHTVARFLLIKARMGKVRILCAREFQNSISESSHQLLSDLINQYNFTDFVITDKSIVNTVTGSDFIFKGLRHNEQSIKSIEGIDIAWVEEAQTISKESIEILTPTVRKEGSKIIYTYNRLLEDDPVHNRLVIEGRPNVLKINVNYDIAIKYGMMPDVIKNEIEDDKINRPSLYKHKWLGEPSSLERKVYRDWNFIDSIPHEARLERYGLDFGYTNDPTAIIALYYYNGGYIVDEIAYQKGLSNKQIADILKSVPPAVVIADSAEPKSIDEIRSYGLTILPVTKGADSVNQGIQFVQMQRISVTNRSNNIIQEYKKYMWMEDKNGKIINKPEDQWNHCFVGNTKIATPNGFKFIKDIVEGDVVLTSKGFSPVSIVHKNGVREVNQYRLHTDTQSVTITCTPEHKIKTGNTWTQISQLKSGQTVESIKSFKGISIEDILERDIFLVEGAASIGKFTSFIMEIYLMTITCIIRTAIRTTIGRKIFHLCPLTFTYSLMGKIRLISLEQLYNQKVPRQQKHGTAQPKAFCGTVNMEKSLGKIVNTQSTPVMNVKKGLNQDTVELLTFATTTAKLEHLEKGGSFQEEVFDLTVEGEHEYFANGILVHNCMDSLRYALDGFRPDTRVMENQWFEIKRNLSQNSR